MQCGVYPFYCKKGETACVCVRYRYWDCQCVTLCEFEAVIFRIFFVWVLCVCSAFKDKLVKIPNWELVSDWREVQRGRDREGERRKRQGQREERGKKRAGESHQESRSCGAPDLERLTVVWCCFHLQIIAPIVVCFSPSCLPMVL